MKRSLPYNKTPALFKVAGPREDRRQRTNHHRYGEVKTRLTIGVTAQSIRYCYNFAGNTGKGDVDGDHRDQPGSGDYSEVGCDHLGIGPGSRVDFRLAPDGSIVVAKAVGARPPGRFAKLVGAAGPGMTTDELMALLRGESE